MQGSAAGCCPSTPHLYNCGVAVRHFALVWFRGQNPPRHSNQDGHQRKQLLQLCTGGSVVAAGRARGGWNGASAAAAAAAAAAETLHALRPPTANPHLPGSQPASRSTVREPGGPWPLPTRPTGRQGSSRTRRPIAGTTIASWCRKMGPSWGRVCLQERSKSALTWLGVGVSTNPPLHTLFVVCDRPGTHICILCTTFQCRGRRLWHTRFGFCSGEPQSR